MTTIGKIRRLASLSTPRQVFTILAVDHRDSMRQLLDPTQPDAVSAEAMTGLKLDLISAIAPMASAVLLDPEYAIAPAVHSHALPGGVGFIAAIEQQGYLGDPTTTETSLMPEWGVAKAARCGAAGVKLLVLYHPDGGAVTERQDRLIEDVVSECRRHDIPLFLEPLAYSLHPSTPVDSADFPRRQVVIDTVRRLGALGPDVLKVQFPLDVANQVDPGLWDDACRELTAASPVPWTLLSGGDSFVSFVTQLDVACRAGASGFLVGRALWREAALAENRHEVIHDIVVARFQELVQIATATARPWTDVVDSRQPDLDWYRTY